MFSSLSLFQSVKCPDSPNCTRLNCIFSHHADLLPPCLDLPVIRAPNVGSSKQTSTTIAPTVPAKRPATSFASPSKSPLTTLEPPRKLQRVGPPQKHLAVPSASHTETGVPILRINAAQSLVPIPVRQAMLKTLFEYFSTLYEEILPRNPTLASEHALRQEDEIYKKSTKLTYRNAVIQCAAAIKRRLPPNTISHPSVGTQDEILAREEAEKSLQSLTLTKDNVERFAHSVDELRKWGYFVEVPPGTGGDKPSMEGQLAKCERCGSQFVVKRMEEADECLHHWGKPFTTRASGEKIRVYTCCSHNVSEGGGCTRGPHVFYESSADDLHSRHPFSTLNPPQGSGAYDVLALDCEMIYTTAGMRVARVSIVDGSGKEVFDEFIHTDEGVHVVDFNTRFSGVNPENYATATRPLASVRESLNSMMNTNTILIGHALDNDLKTLRIIHHRCVDTALLFPHKAGPPYRRALRDLVRDNLGKLIQTGGSTVGHSSVEDAAATLDLVRWFILSQQRPGQPP